MMMPRSFNCDIISQIKAAISAGHRNDHWEMSQLYKGVKKAKGAPLYVGFIEDSGGITYLGRYDHEENAAKARDLVALKFWGPSVETNFPKSEYKGNLETLASMSKQDVVAAVRGLSRICWRSTSRYRGVSRHQFTGKWEANVYLGYRSFFLGVFGTENEAAIAYDIEIIKWSGIRAITNFDINCYDIRAIVDSIIPQEEEWEEVEDCDTTLSLEIKGLTSEMENDFDATSTFGWAFRPAPSAAFRGYKNKRMRIGEPYAVPQQGQDLSLAFKHSPASGFKPFKMKNPI